MTLRALIFDVDGTLAETEEAHRRAFNEAFAAAGLPWVWDKALYAELLHVGGGRERLRHFVETRIDAAEAAAWNDDRIAALHRDKTARYQRMVVEDGLPVRPGVVRLMEEALASGLKLGIATTTSRGNVEALIERSFPAGARAWIDAIAAGEDAPRKKPWPDVYQSVLGRLRLDGGACLAIEDALIGLQAARAAGIPTVVTPSAYTAGEDFAGATAVVASLDEVDLERLRLLHAAATVPGAAQRQ